MTVFGSGLRGLRAACLPSKSGILTGFFFLSLAGCAPLQPRVSALEGTPPEGRDSRELVGSLAQRADQFRSLRALATVYYWAGNESGGVQEAILVQRPDRLRLETLTPLGAISIVTVDRGEVVVFHPRESRFYRGRSTKENLFLYTQIPLGLDELTSLLMGLPPFDAQASWQGGGNSISRQIEGERREVITFDPKLGTPAKWERIDAYGRPELSAVFSDFSRTPAGLFPLKISFNDHANERRLEIRYQQPEVNVDLPLALFVQEKPAHLKEIPLESLGG